MTVRLFLLGLWLQIVVIVFVVLQLKRSVQTPPRDWLTRMMQLLGM
jgi:hypothetical protein